MEQLRWLLLQMFCFTLYIQKDVAEHIVGIHWIIVLFWNLKSLSFAFIHFHSFWQSLSFVVPPLSLVVTRCHSLPLVATRCITRCHSLYYSLSFIVFRCTTCYHLLSLLVICYQSLYHWLLLVATRCTTRLCFYKRSEKSAHLVQKS